MSRVILFALFLACISISCRDVHAEAAIGNANANIAHLMCEEAKRVKQSFSSSPIAIGSAAKINMLLYAARFKDLWERSSHLHEPGNELITQKGQQLEQAISRFLSIKGLSIKGSATSQVDEPLRIAVLSRATEFLNYCGTI